MFSALGNIILGKPRQAENADTRLGIRRHDPEQEQKRKNENRDPSGGFADMQDDTTVSIAALRVFLENFLLSQQPEENAGNESPTELVMPSPGQVAPVAARNSQALNAYQAGARTAAKPSAPVEAPAQPAAPQLESHEIRSIHKLLEDLAGLSERGVEFLRIERSDTFLHSLEEAVARLK